MKADQNSSDSSAETQESLTMDDIVRAFKDEGYRATLDPEKLKKLPDSPIGFVRLLDGQFNLQAERSQAGLSWFTGTCGHVCQILTPEFGCDYVPACW